MLYTHFRLVCIGKIYIDSPNKKNSIAAKDIGMQSICWMQGICGRGEFVVKWCCQTFALARVKDCDTDTENALKIQLPTAFFRLMTVTFKIFIWYDIFTCILKAVQAILPLFPSSRSDPKSSWLPICSNWLSYLHRPSPCCFLHIFWKLKSIPCVQSRGDTLILWSAAEWCGHADSDFWKGTSSFSKMEMQKLTHTTF